MRRVIRAQFFAASAAEFRRGREERIRATDGISKRHETVAFMGKAEGLE